MKRAVLIFIVLLAVHNQVNSYQFPFWSILNDIDIAQKESYKQEAEPECFFAPCSPNRVNNFWRTFKWFKSQELKYGKQNPFFRF